MTGNPIRWGIVGASHFAARHMAPAIHLAAGARLCALATSDPEKAGPFLDLDPDLGVMGYDDILADDGIDALYVPLPNHMHVDWTLKALAAGKHVLTEKPIAMQADEIDRLIAARDESGLVAAEAYMIVHHPRWQRVRDLVRDGAVGDLVLVDTVFSYDNSGDPQNIRNRPDTGGGSLPDIGVYTFGSARWVTGEEPRALDARIRRENGVDVFAHVTADFPSFRFSSVTSMRMHPRQEVSFHGREGVLRVVAPFNANVFDQAQIELHRMSADGALSVTVERWPGVDQYVLQVEAFGRAVRDGEPFAWSLEDARGTQAMIDRALAA